MATTSDEFRNLINALSQCLVAYQAYLSACRIYGETRSEALFYEPIARVAQASGWKVNCEFPVPSASCKNGDNKRIDFSFEKDGNHLALEVKYSGRKQKFKDLSASREVEKFRSKELLQHRKFLILFGRLTATNCAKEAFKTKDFEFVKYLTLESGRVKYGALVYEWNKRKTSSNSTRRKYRT